MFYEWVGMVFIFSYRDVALLLQLMMIVLEKNLLHILVTYYFIYFFADKIVGCWIEFLLASFSEHKNVEEVPL